MIKIWNPSCGPIGPLRIITGGKDQLRNTVQKTRDALDTDFADYSKSQIPDIGLQGCGSALILYKSGSSSFSECGSRSRSRSSLTKFEEKKSWVFLSCKKHKRLLKSKKNGACANLLLKNLINLQLLLICNFLAFFLFLVNKFTLPDPDPGGKMNADPDPQPWIDRSGSAGLLEAGAAHFWNFRLRLQAQTNSGSGNPDLQEPCWRYLLQKESVLHRCSRGCRRSWRGSAASPSPKWATGSATRGSDTRRISSRKPHAHLEMFGLTCDCITVQEWRNFPLYRWWKKDQCCGFE